MILRALFVWLMVILNTSAATLEWDRNVEPEVTGYRVYQGTQSRVYNKITDVGDVTECVLTGLVNRVAYYFAVIAYTADGLESEFSEEISYIQLPSSKPKKPRGLTSGVFQDSIGIMQNDSESEAPEAQEPLFGVRIERTDEEYVTRERDPNSSYDGDDIAHDHTIDGYELVTEKYAEDFVLNEEPTGVWFLVVVFYSTGDSFHIEENCIDLVSFVKSEKDADAILCAIEADYKAYYADDGRQSGGPLKVVLPDAGRTEEIYAGTWKGHFQRLNSVEVRGLSKISKVEFNPPPRRFRRR